MTLFKIFSVIAMLGVIYALVIITAYESFHKGKTRKPTEEVILYQAYLIIIIPLMLFTVWIMEQIQTEKNIPWWMRLRYHGTALLSSVLIWLPAYFLLDNFRKDPSKKAGLRTEILWTVWMTAGTVISFLSLLL